MLVENIQHSTQHSTRRMETTLLRLFEIYENMPDPDALLNESLTSGNMSTFLFEADEDAAKDAIESAADAARKGLENLIATSDALGIPMIKDAAGDLKSKLDRLTIDDKAFGGFREFLGMTTKQLTFIGNSIDGINKSVFAVCKITAKLLEQSKLDPKSEEVKDKFLQDLAAEGKISGIKNDDDLIDLLSKKMGETVKGKAKGILSFLMSKIKGVEPIKLEPRKFVAEFIRVPIEKIVAWADGPLGSAAADPPPGASPAPGLEAAATAVGAKPADLAAAPNTPPKTAAGGEPPGQQQATNTTFGKAIFSTLQASLEPYTKDNEEATNKKAEADLKAELGQTLTQASDDLATNITQLWKQGKWRKSMSDRTRMATAAGPGLKNAEKAIKDAMAANFKVETRFRREKLLREQREQTGTSLFIDRWAQLAGIKGDER